MKTYAEKLKDPRWFWFREKVFGKKGMACAVCGEDKPATSRNHVHHLRYIDGMDPWDYSMDDVAVLCPECHGEIHEAEKKMRDIVRKSPPWVAFHFIRLAECLDEIDDQGKVTVLSRAKANAVETKYGRDI